MIRMMTTTWQAAGLGAVGGNPAAPVARVGAALQRAIGFALTAGGFAVIAVHALHRVAG